MSTLQAVTIDPPGAKDLDDAIWVDELHDGWLVTVCIANVAEQVHHHSLIDVTARARIATHYFRDGSRPMLPRKFAEDMTSLLPHAPRSVVVLRFGVDRNGEIGQTMLNVGEITSAAQLTYADVPRLLQDGGAHAKMLMDAEQCTYALLGRRRSGGALAFYDAQHGWAITENGTFKKLERQNVVGYRIVHELMLMTNRLLAEYAHTHHIPILYRNHEGTADRSSLLFTLSEVLDRPDLAIEEYRRSVSCQLQRAEYGASARGHVALNVGRYCHATSPIRRYADLVTQRQIVAHVRGQRLPYSQSDLQVIADEINTALRAREAALSDEMKARANRRALAMIESADKPITPTDLERVVKVLVRTGGDIPAQVRPLFDRPLPIVLMAFVLAASDRDNPAWIEVRRSLLASLDGSTAISVLTTAAQHAELKIGPMAILPARNGGDPPHFTVMISMSHDGRMLTAVGEGSAQNKAKHEAAITLAYLVAGIERPLPVLPDTSPEKAREAAPTQPGKDPISALMELAQAAGKPLPTFMFAQDGPGNKPTFRCACSYDGKTTTDTGPTKQASKRSASALMLGLCVDS